MAHYYRLGSAAMLFALLYSAIASSHCDNPGVDKTLDEQATGSDVVTATADKIRESGLFGDDHGFLRSMAKVESDNGELLLQGTGGIWKVSREIFKDVDSYIRLDASNLDEEFEEIFCFNWIDVVYPNGFSTATVPLYSALDVPLYSALAVMVRLQSTGKTLTDNDDEQAEIWKNLKGPTDSGLDEDHFVRTSKSLRGI